MATVDEVVRTMINLSKHDGATKTSVMAGLKKEYKHLPPRTLNTLVIKAGALIAKAQKQ